MKLGMKERFLREERGFTLIEMLITTVIWIMVLFALYSVFDMTITSFRFGNNKVEAVEGARLGLEKMEREIRQAYVFDRANGNTALFESWNVTNGTNATQIRFGNDLDGNEKIECLSALQCEKIGYQVYDPPPADGNYALGRDKTSAGTTNTVANLQPAVEDVDYVSSADTGLAFTYCHRLQDDTDVDDPDNCLPGFDVATSEADINMVRIQLRVRINEGNLQDATQTLSTDVALRNRSG